MGKNDGLEDLFLNECERICEDEHEFSNFKRNQIFTKIIGNDIRPKSTSDAWYNFIKNTDMIDRIGYYKTNDYFGNPYLYYYPQTGPISPGTLYFLSITHDINTRLVNLKGKTICEIGSGYGGQSKIFLDYGCKSVSLIDRNQTLNLAKKYISKFKYKNVNFYNTDNITNDKYDVVVSNWCICELDREGTTFYLKNVVKNSNYGYFLTNYRNKQNTDWFVEQLQSIYSKVTVEEENPKTNSNTNYAILCKK